MKRLIMLMAAAALCGGTAEAKWWIFGSSGGEIGLKYLYINGVSADEAGPRIQLFQEALPADGSVRIVGKAALGRSGVGSVRISLDDKATWQEVKFSENGAFEHSFRPEARRRYVLLVEVTDTAGKTNKVDETRKELSVSEETIRDRVRGVLDALFDAYNREDLDGFMRHVGEDFAGDKTLLEQAVRRDFDSLSSISMRFTVNNIAAAGGRVYVSIQYNRMVFINKTGQTSTDSGATEFAFASSGEGLALYSMKQPLVFGLSDAENVASGTVLGGAPGALSLDDSGGLGSLRTLTKTNSGATQTLSYLFEDDAFYNETNLPPDPNEIVSGDIAFNPSHLAPSAPRGVKIKVFSGRSIESLGSSEVMSASGYISTVYTPSSLTGHSFGVLAGGRFYAVEFLSFSPDDGSVPFTTTFRVRSF